MPSDRSSPPGCERRSRARVLGPFPVATVALLVLPGCGLVFPLSSSPGGDPGADAGADASCNVECLPPATCARGVCSDTCDGVDCDPDERCSDGQCVSIDLDDDGDGFSVSSDCDDHDASVIPGSMVPCESECGSGTRTCEDGSWQPCTAPTDCECVPGDTRDEACGRCGSSTRPCGEDGRWGAAGECAGEGECLPGGQQTEACAGCGQRARTCSAGCTWGAWGDCVAGGECVSGVIENRACGQCGTQGRLCGANCVWGDWGVCANEHGDCTPGDSQPCEAGCGLRVCGADCEWGACSVGCHCLQFGDIPEGCIGAQVIYPPMNDVACCMPSCQWEAGECS
ncbi:MAG: hypothetical protein HYY06_09070 [Deltaproteobacteria bacterium]|nr:hypothetical protein [Deltaproteobacteria bacterium]